MPCLLLTLTTLSSALASSTKDISTVKRGGIYQEPHFLAGHFLTSATISTWVGAKRITFPTLQAPMRRSLMTQPTPWRTATVAATELQSNGPTKSKSKPLPDSPPGG